MQYLKNTLISTFVMICLFFFMGIGKIDKIKKTYIKVEVIVFVDMKVKRNVPLNKISNFTKRYQEFVDQTEINSLGWSYHKSGNKIVLIERYKNELIKDKSVFNHLETCIINNLEILNKEFK